MKRIVSILIFLACYTNANAEQDYYKEGLKCVTSLQDEYQQTNHIGLVNIDGTIYTGIYKESYSRVEKDIPAKTLILDDGHHAIMYISKKSLVLGPMNRKSEYSPAEIANTLKNAPNTFGDCEPWQIDPSKFIKPQKKK